MPLNKTEGARLSKDYLLREYLGTGLLENNQTPISCASCLAFKSVAGDSLRIERVGRTKFTSGTGPAFDIPPLNPTPSADAVPEPLLEGLFPLKLMVQDVKVENFVDINQSNAMSQLGVQLDAAQRRMVYKYMKTMSEGDSSINPAEFDGMKKLVSPSQTIQTTDTVDYNLTLTDMSRLESMITTNEGYPSAYVTNQNGLNNIMAAFAAAGVEYDMCPPCKENSLQNILQLDDPDPTDRVLCYNGTPIVLNDFIDDDGHLGSFSSAGWIFAVVFGEPDGLFGLVSDNQQGLSLRESLDQTLTNTIHRVEMSAGLALGSQGSLAALQYMPAASTL